MRRTSLDVTVNILQAAQNGANKTRIVYRANLNFEIIKQYLETLKNSGLIETKSDGKYHTTMKGTKFIADYHNLMKPFDHTLIRVPIA